MELHNALLAYTDTGSVLVFAVCLLLGLVWTSTRRRGRSKLPPGPWGVPLLGVIPILSRRTKERYKVLQEWAAQYGDMFTMRLGTQSAVVLSSPQIVREAFVKKADYFSDRPVNLKMILTVKNNTGLVMHNGPSLFHLRKFTQTVMRDFGVGKTSLEEKIHEEVKATFREIDAFNQGPFYPKDLLNKAVSNIINSIVFGTRLDYSDRLFSELMEVLDFIFKSPGPASAAFNFLPIPEIFYRSRLKKYKSRIDVVRSYMSRKIEEHRAGFDESNMRDFIDLYLSIEKEKGQGKITEENMLMAIQDLFVAGSETTSTTLQWCLVYMVLHPDVQRKCRREILQVAGEGRLPSMADRSKLVYTEATLLEVQRLGNTASGSLMHCTSDDVSLGDYFLPKGTIVIANIYSMHMDARYWREPHSFNPERWIDESGKLIRSEAFMPFSVGRRACVGENLAKMELFLYFTSLLQNYEFRVGDGPPDTTGEQGITTMPRPYTVVAHNV